MKKIMSKLMLVSSLSYMSLSHALMSTSNIHLLRSSASNSEALEVYYELSDIQRRRHVPIPAIVYDDNCQVNLDIAYYIDDYNNPSVVKAVAQKAAIAIADKGYHHNPDSSKRMILLLDQNLIPARRSGVYPFSDGYSATLSYKFVLEGPNSQEGGIYSGAYSRQNRGKKNWVADRRLKRGLRHILKLIPECVVR